MNDIKLLEIYKSTFGIQKFHTVEESDAALARMRRLKYYRQINVPIAEVAEIIYEDWNVSKDRREANHIAKKLIAKLANGHA